MENHQTHLLSLEELAAQKEIAWIEEIKSMGQEELRTTNPKKYPVGKAMILEAYKKSDRSRISYYEQRLAQLKKGAHAF